MSGTKLWAMVEHVSKHKHFYITPGKWHETFDVEPDIDDGYGRAFSFIDDRGNKSDPRYALEFSCAHLYDGNWTLHEFAGNPNEAEQ